MDDQGSAGNQSSEAGTRLYKLSTRSFASGALGE